MLGYLDPATGGMILQAIVAAVAAAAVGVRFWWGRIKHMLGMSRPEPAPSDEHAA